MYAVFGNIYHQYTPNVSIYTHRNSWIFPLNMVIFHSKMLVYQRVISNKHGDMIIIPIGTG